MGLFRRATPIDPAEIARLQEELATLRDALDRHDASARAFHDKLSSLDDRLTSVSTEHANQIGEHGHDKDANSAPPPIDAVKAGQVRLANEQARYQIAFREDLARLAQELKRPR